MERLLWLLDQLIDLYRLISVVLHFLNQSLSLVPLRTPDVTVAEPSQILNILVQRLDILYFLVVLLFVKPKFMLVGSNACLRI